ncbi:MAG: hypothetical protein AAGB26_15835 [Planctomycetota bacterium]
MDELDRSLLDAWHRVFAACKADPAEARRRYDRMHTGGTYDRPVRAWCVAIRASDTRLTPRGPGPSESSGNGASQALKRWMTGRPLSATAEDDGLLNPLAQREGRGRVLADHECQTLAQWMGLADEADPPPLQGVYDDTPMCPIRAQAAHEIIIDGELMRRLGGPVRIDYPGLPIDEAAKVLGKHKEALRHWLPHKQGRTRAARAQAAKGFGYDDTTLKWQQHEPTEDRPLGVRYVPLGTLGRGDRGGGMETPVVWSDWQLDPGAVKGRPPAKWWGTLWESLAEKIPAEFEQVIERVPRFVPYPDRDGKKRGRFRGWWWKCPGLNQCSKAADGIRGLKSERSQPISKPVKPRPPMPSAALGCGRLVSTLYAPLPIWTVGRYLGIEEGLEVEGLSGEWLPGVMDRWAGRRRLACEHCWKVRRVSFADHRGWNELVTYLSGGLLYGHEVEKPSYFQYERRRAYAKRRKKRREKERGGDGRQRAQPAVR